MYNISNFRGDKKHVIDCTGDCVVGDKVAFERATFTGSFRNAKFAGFELVIGEIVADSYGAAKQQHTFTIRFENGETTKIKGRNLYKNRVYRQRWENEAEREKAQAEKHVRGNMARSAREERKLNSMYAY